MCIRPIDPECCCACRSTVPTQLLRMLCTCAYPFVSLCCARFLLALVTCTDDPHRPKCATKSKVTATVIVHPCNRIIEQIIGRTNASEIWNVLSSSHSTTARLSMGRPSQCCFGKSSPRPSGTKTLRNQSNELAWWHPEC